MVFFRSQSQNFLHELGRYQLIQFCICRELVIYNLSQAFHLYAMLLIAVKITGIIIINEREIVENLSFIGYNKGMNG